MKLIKNTYQLFFVLAVFALGLLGSNAVIAQDQVVGLSVVANTQGVPDELTSEEMKKIFLGQKQSWGNNQLIKIAMLKPDTDLGEVVSNKLYGMTPNELKKYWLAMAFQGRAKTPIFFDTTAEVKEYISATHGSIGIIEYASEEKLKFVPIDNKDFF